MPLLQVNVPVLESYNEAAIDVPPELLSASGLNNSSRSSPSKSVVSLVIYRLNRLCVLFVFNLGQKSRYAIGCCPTVIAAANEQIGRNYAITTRYQIDPLPSRGLFLETTENFSGPKEPVVKLQSAFLLEEKP